MRRNRARRVAIETVAEMLVATSCCAVKQVAISAQFRFFELMKPSHLLAVVVISAAAIAGCAPNQPAPGGSGGGSTGTIPPRCTAAWNQAVDRKLQISDASGHGPDIGSTEWQNAVARRSGVTDASGHGPDPGSDEWCRAVDFKVFGRR